MPRGEGTSARLEAAESAAVAPDRLDGSDDAVTPERDAARALRHPPRVIALRRRRTPYDRCFYPALAREGVEIIDGRLQRRWLTRQLRRGDVAHLQFPSFIYARPTRRAAIVRRFARFIGLLLLIRARGGRLVWTAHNLMPHDPTPVAGLDRLGRRIVIRLSERIFVHGAAAAALLRAHFPRAAAKLRVIQHGNWLDLYPCTRTRRDARAKLGVSEVSHVFLFFGRCRPYKNLHGLIEAFRQAGGDAELIVAGKFERDEYLRHVVALAQGDPRIRFVPRFVPDDEIQDFLLACDCVVLPYLDILTSGAVMLPLTFGRPVVSVRAGHLEDVVSPEVGILFDADDPNGLARALVDVRHLRFDADRIRSHARRFSWTAAARAFADALWVDPH